MSQLYMLDTKVVSELARYPQGPLSERIAKVEPDAVCVSIITAAELHYGAAKKGSVKLSARIEAILGGLKVLPLDAPSDRGYGDIRASLEAIGKPIGPNDLLIAAHARAVGAVLVTANMGEFNRVPDLTVENWLD